jgi:hypothetical protein
MSSVASHMLQGCQECVPMNQRLCALQTALYRQTRTGCGLLGVAVIVPTDVGYDLISPSVADPCELHDITVLKTVLLC